MLGVSGYKEAKYITFILEYLGLNNKLPNTLCCDNISSIMMANFKKTTGRAREIYTHTLYLQEWVGMGKLFLKHTRTEFNPLDVSTKLMG